MNLLVNVLLESVIEPLPQADRLSLREVAASLDFQLLEPTSPAEAEALERARVRLVPAAVWESRPPCEPIPDGYEPARWSVAVPVAHAGVVAFVPDDDQPAQEIALFTRIGDLAGRLRLWLPEGPGSAPRAMTFEAGLHCADAECDTDDECGSCCPSCLCRERQVGLLTMLVCGCSQHGIFPPSR